MGFLDYFRRGTKQPNELERHILESVMDLLSPAERARFAARLEQINLVQRVAGSETNFFAMKQGKPCFDESARLIESNEEIPLANFTLESSNTEALTGTIWLVYGQLFSIEFDSPVEDSDMAVVASSLTDGYMRSRESNSGYE